MDYSFGLETMLTETTFVRDEKLNQYHDDFENCVSSNQLFREQIQLGQSYALYQLHIERQRLPLGSPIFQTVMAEFRKNNNRTSNLGHSK